MVRDFKSMKSLGFLGLVFDTGLIITPLMGHLGCLASHWSVPVSLSMNGNMYKSGENRAISSLFLTQKPDFGSGNCLSLTPLSNCNSE